MESDQNPYCREHCNKQVTGKGGRYLTRHNQMQAPEFFLKSLYMYFVSLSIKSPHFIEYKGSILVLQNSAKCPYPQPAQSITRFSNRIIKNPF